MNIYGIVDLYKHSIGYKKIQENKEMAAYALISFFFPIVVPQPQIFLGSVVNTTLVLSAFYLKGKNVLPLIVLPSIAAVARGLIFGPLTIYLVYMLPFIWIGNALLIGLMKLFYIKLKANYVVSSIASVSSKVLVLFCSAYVLFSLGVVPEFFVYLMGIMQAATAIIGCTSAYFVNLSRKRFFE